jgi:flagellar hook-length control protein FliK
VGPLLDEGVEQRLCQSDAPAIGHQPRLFLAQKRCKLLFADAAAKAVLLGAKACELQHFGQKRRLQLGRFFAQTCGVWIGRGGTRHKRRGSGGKDVHAAVLQNNQIFATMRQGGKQAVTTGMGNIDTRSMTEVITHMIQAIDKPLTPMPFRVSEPESAPKDDLDFATIVDSDAADKSDLEMNAALCVPIVCAAVLPKVAPEWNARGSWELTTQRQPAAGEVSGSDMVQRALAIEPATVDGDMLTYAIPLPNPADVGMTLEPGANFARPEDPGSIEQQPGALIARESVDTGIPQGLEKPVTAGSVVFDLPNVDQPGEPTDQTAIAKVIAGADRPVLKPAAVLPAAISTSGAMIMLATADADLLEPQDVPSNAKAPKSSLQSKPAGPSYGHPRSFSNHFDGVRLPFDAPLSGLTAIHAAGRLPRDLASGSGPISAADQWALAPTDLAPAANASVTSAASTISVGRSQMPGALPSDPDSDQTDKTSNLLFRREQGQSVAAPPTTATPDAPVPVAPGQTLGVDATPAQPMYPEVPDPARPFHDAAPQMSLSTGHSRHEPIPNQIMAPVLALTSVAKTDANKVELILAPQELGRVRVDFEANGDAMRVVLTAEQPDTLDLLRRHADQFIAELRQAGYAQPSLSFGQWTGSSQGQGAAPFDTANGGTADRPAPVSGLANTSAPSRHAVVPGRDLDLRF